MLTGGWGILHHDIRVIEVPPVCPSGSEHFVGPVGKLTKSENPNRNGTHHASLTSWANETSQVISSASRSVTAQVSFQLINKLLLWARMTEMNKLIDKLIRVVEGKTQEESYWRRRSQRLTCDSLTSAEGVSWWAERQSDVCSEFNSSQNANQRFTVLDGCEKLCADSRTVTCAGLHSDDVNLKEEEFWGHNRLLELA